MSLETWIAFAIAAAIILVMPGPTILLVVSQSLVHGPKAAVPLVLGVGLGDFVAVSASLLGLGVVLAASALLFSVIKWIGAAYLLYLGFSLWRTPVVAEGMKVKVEEVSARRHFYNAFIVTALNPKGIVFFLAFVPQFLNYEAAVVPQMVIFGATFLVLAIVNAALYAIFAGRIRHWFRKPAARKWLNRTGGTALIGAGVMTAAMQRA